MYSLLVIDDESYAMQYYWDALDDRDYDLQVTRCASTDDAVRHYNADIYHLIVLDLFMPPGILGEIGTDDGIRSGIVLYEDIRKRFHLLQVPVLVLTNYYRQGLVEELMELERGHNKTPLLWIREKADLDPFQLRDEVLAICASHPLPPVASVDTDQQAHNASNTQLGITIPDTEYPNVAPYFAEELATGGKVRLYFSNFQPGEESLFAAEWRSPPSVFGDVFKDRVEHPDECRNMLKLMIHDDVNERIQGIYYTGGDSVEWYRSIIFEAAPWNRRGIDQREMKHIGKIMVARFIRECMRRKNRREFAIMVGQDHLQDDETRVEIVPKAQEFFRGLGFRSTDLHPAVFYLTNERAITILNEVSPPIIW